MCDRVFPLSGPDDTALCHVLGDCPSRRGGGGANRGGGRTGRGDSAPSATGPVGGVNSVGVGVGVGVGAGVGVGVDGGAGDCVGAPAATACDVIDVVGAPAATTGVVTVGTAEMCVVSAPARAADSADAADRGVPAATACRSDVDAPTPAGRATNWPKPLTAISVTAGTSTAPAHTAANTTMARFARS